MRRLRTLLSLFAGAVGAFQGSAVCAQPIRADSLFTSGSASFRGQRYDQAVATFQELVSAFPEYVDASQGSGAYWFGASLVQANRPSEAHEVWRNGMTRLGRQGVVDGHLADAFVRSTFEGDFRGDRTAAADAYLKLFDFLDAPVAPELRPILVEHVRELLPVLPSETIAALALAAFVEGSDSDAPPSGAGTRLAAWWRANDVVPSTRKNERLEEHLERVAYARTHYRTRDDFDARGLLHIRFGPPVRTASINFRSEIQSGSDPVSKSLATYLQEFPPNEIWVYTHINKDAVFILTKRGSTFELGEVRDLLPRSLMSGLGASERGITKGAMVVRALEVAYGILSIHNVAYASRYSDVLSPVEGIAPGQSYRADLVASTALRDAQVMDDQLALVRDALLPTAYTNVLDEVEHAEMPARIARFLDPDGTTRTELYWGIPPGGLVPSRRELRALRREGVEWEQAVMLQSIAHHDARRFTRRIDHQRLSLTGIDRDRSTYIEPRTYVARGDTALFHFAAQWNLHAVWENAQGRLRLRDEPVLTYFARFDSIPTLSNDPAVLEMSDLKAILVEESRGLSTLDPDVASDLPGLPVPILGKGTTLALYFEVYHLQPNPTGESRFEVTYQVSRPGAPVPLTTSTSLYTTDGTTAREAVTVDLARQRNVDEAEVTLLITEPATGRSTSRNVRILTER